MLNDMFNLMEKNPEMAEMTNCLKPLMDSIKNNTPFPDPTEVAKNFYNTLIKDETTKKCVNELFDLTNNLKKQEEEIEPTEAIDKVFDIFGKMATNDKEEKTIEKGRENFQIIKLFMQIKTMGSSDYTQEDIDLLYLLSQKIRDCCVPIEIFSPLMHEEFNDIIVDGFSDMFSKIAQKIEEKLIEKIE